MQIIQKYVDLTFVLIFNIVVDHQQLKSITEAQHVKMSSLRAEICSHILERSNGGHLGFMQVKIKMRNSNLYSYILQFSMTITNYRL